MAYNRNHARKLCNAAELALFEASTAGQLSGLGAAQLRAKRDRARRLRDKQQDLLRRQRLASRRSSGNKGGRSGVANERTAQKLKLFSEALARFDAQLEKVEHGDDKAPARKSPARKKSAGKKSAAKKSAGKKTAGKKAAGKKAAGKKAAGKKAAGKKAAGKKAAGKKAAGKKAAGKKAAGKKAAGKKETGKKVASREASGKKAAGKKTMGNAAARKAASTPKAKSASRTSSSDRAAAPRRAGTAPSARKRPGSGTGERLIHWPKLPGQGGPDEADKPLTGAAASAASPVRQAAGGVPHIAAVTGRSKTGFVSDDAAKAAQQSKVKAAHNKAILGHVSSHDRRNQAKRDQS